MVMTERGIKFIVVLNPWNISGVRLHQRCICDYSITIKDDYWSFLLSTINGSPTEPHPLAHSLSSFNSNVLTSLFHFNKRSQDRLDDVVLDVQSVTVSHATSDLFGANAAKVDVGFVTFKQGLRVSQELFICPVWNNMWTMSAFENQRASIHVLGEKCHRKSNKSLVIWLAASHALVGKKQKYNNDEKYEILQGL
uniref:Uncharacterized protein n=1 Tax=Romanomermis culicivorax TaxID=13658 RepID=A0A915JA98_ROMCU